jgi:hypothetical protein
MYLRLIGQVAVVAIEWAPTADGINVTVASEMQHGINADVTQIAQKLLDIPGRGLARKLRMWLQIPFLEMCSAMKPCLSLKGDHMSNKTLERDRATRAAFWKVCGSGEFTFYLSFWGLKARPLSSPLAVKTTAEETI